MQMIDVLKRLAELDAQNPNIVKENQTSKIGTMGLDAFPDEIARMRASREKMERDADWLLKNKPTDPCPKCGESSTYRDSYGTSQYMKCARCGKVRLSSDDIAQNQDMSEGSRTAKPGEHVPLNDPKRKANADAQRAKMAADKAAEPGKKLAAKIAAKEGLEEGLQECGMMGSGMSQPHTPASINMTADSGAELTGMLKDIMSLAGLRQVGADDLGHEHEPAVLSTEPGMSISKVDDSPLDMKGMIAKIDSLNPSDDEEKVDEWDNEPAEDINGSMDNEAMLNTGMHNQDPAGAPGAGDGRHLKNNPIATPEETYESLMSDYRSFVAEGNERSFEIYDIKTSKSIHKFTAPDMYHANIKADDWLESNGKSGEGMKVRSADQKVSEESVAEDISKHELESSAYTMTLDQFVSVYGEENAHIWHKVNGEQSANESVDILKLAGLR